VGEIMAWIESNRPKGLEREQAAEWVMSVAFTGVSAGALAGATLEPLGGAITEDQFLDLAREAYRRAQRVVSVGSN
jgi:hypothetical protein